MDWRTFLFLAELLYLGGINSHSLSGQSQLLTVNIIKNKDAAAMNVTEGEKGEGTEGNEDEDDGDGDDDDDDDNGEEGKEEDDDDKWRAASRGGEETEQHLVNMIRREKIIMLSNLDEIKKKLDKDNRYGMSKAKEIYKGKFEKILGQLRRYNTEDNAKKISDKRIAKTKKQAEKDDLDDRVATAKEKLGSTLTSLKTLSTKGKSLVSNYNSGNYLAMSDDLMSFVGTLVGMCPHPACLGVSAFFDLASTMLGLFNPVVKPSIDKKLENVKNEILSSLKGDKVVSFASELEQMKSKWNNVWSRIDIEDGKMPYEKYKSITPKVDDTYGYDKQKEMFGYVTKWTEEGYGKVAFKMLTTWAIYHAYRDKTVTRVLELIPNPKKHPRMNKIYKGERDHIIWGQDGRRREIFTGLEDFLRNVDRTTILALGYFYPPGFDEASKAINEVAQSLYYEDGHRFDDNGEEVKKVITMDPLGGDAAMSNGYYFIESKMDYTWNRWTWWATDSLNYKYAYWGKDDAALGRKLTFDERTPFDGMVWDDDTFLTKISEGTKIKGCKKISLHRAYTSKRWGWKKYDKVFDIRFYTETTADYKFILMGFSPDYAKKWKANPKWAEKNKYSDEFRIIRLKETYKPTDYGGRIPAVIANPYGNQFLYNTMEGNNDKGWLIKLKPMTKSGNQVDKKFVWHITEFTQFYRNNKSGNPS